MELPCNSSRIINIGKLFRAYSLELNIAQHKDIAGTISSDPDTPNTYPLYTIGTAFQARHATSQHSGTP
ncbi:hypothetical protein, partial [Bathymodiolus platifrons methanotrophic gill symbiont]|uniref:hypothetical protein n=1 Tax=Bathymodiolus platifrons methanotrophic gill symbiont TaxID=113268 RepID=UPI001C8D78A8